MQKQKKSSVKTAQFNKRSNKALKNKAESIKSIQGKFLYQLLSWFTAYITQKDKLFSGQNLRRVSLKVWLSWRQALLTQGTKQRKTQRWLWDQQTEGKHRSN